jgi:hypothetical protein
MFFDREHDFLATETISHQRKLFPAKGNYLPSQETMSCPRKKFKLIKKCFRPTFVYYIKE